MHELGKGAATRRRNSCRHLVRPWCFCEFKATGPETPKDLRFFPCFCDLVTKTSGDSQKQNSNFELFTSLLGCFTVFRFSQNLRGARKTRHFVRDVICLSGPLSATWQAGLTVKSSSTVYSGPLAWLAACGVVSTKEMKSYEIRVAF